MNHDLFYILLTSVVLILLYRYKPWRYLSEKQRAQMAKNAELRLEVAAQLLTLQTTRMHRMHFSSSVRKKKRHLKSLEKGFKKRGRKWKTLEKEEVDLLLIQESLRYALEKRKNQAKDLESAIEILFNRRDPKEDKKRFSDTASLKRRKPEEFLTPDQQLLLLAMMEESKFEEPFDTGGLSFSEDDPYMRLGLSNVDSFESISGMGVPGESIMGGGFGGDGFGGGGFGGGGGGD